MRTNKVNKVYTDSDTVRKIDTYKDGAQLKNGQIIIKSGPPSILEHLGRYF